MNWIITAVGILLVLALSAAAVGPIFVDWTAYRGTLEAYATRALGAEVTLAGEARLRLLPTPWVEVSDVAIGDPAAPFLTADTVELDIDLSPLLSGEVRILDLTLEGPELAATVEPDGSLAAPPLAAAADADVQSWFDLDSVVVESVAVTAGRVTVSDQRTGNTVSVADLELTGAARSLRGPFSAEGRATVAGEVAELRVAGGAMDAAGDMALSASLVPGSGAATAQFEGRVRPSLMTPLLNGQLTLTGPATTPWRVRGRLEVDLEAVLLSRATLSYGSDLLPLELRGAAVASLTGDEPPAIALEARQLDLDRVASALAGTSGANGLEEDDDGLGPGRDEIARPLPAAEALAVIERHLAPLAGAGADLPLGGPVLTELNVGTVLVGGALIQDLSLSAEADAGGLFIDRAEALFPGDTDVVLSGRLDANGFRGEMGISAAQPQLLSSWWSGNVGDGPPLSPLILESGLAVTAAGIDAERLSARLGESSASGRVQYRFAEAGEAPLLDVALDAPAIEASDVLALAATLRNAGSTGSDGNGRRRPDILLDVVGDRFEVGEVAGAALTVDAELRADTLDIAALTAESIAGGEVFVRGTIGRLDSDPLGTIDGTVSFADGGPLAEALTNLMPDNPSVERLAQAFPALAPAELTFRVGGGGQGEESDLSVALDGTLGGTTVDLDMQGSPLHAAWRDRPAGLTLRLSNERADDFLGQLGLVVPGDPPAEPGRARVSLAANGTPAEGLRTELNADLLGASLTYDGTVALSEVPWLDGTWAAEAETGTLLAALLDRPLPELGPLSVSAEVVSRDDGTTAISDVAGEAGGVRFSGDLVAQSGALSGAIELGSADLQLLSGLVLGPNAWEDPGTAPEGGEEGGPAADDGPGSLWPRTVFGPALLPEGDVTLAVRTDRLTVGPHQVDEATFDLALSPDGLALTNLAGRALDGAVTGEFELSRSDTRADLRATLNVTDADLAAVSAPDGGAPIATGRVDLRATAGASGFTVASLVADLSGEGSLNLSDARLSWVNPAPFTLIDEAVSAAAPPEDAAVNTALATHLEGGALTIPSLQARLDIAGGTVRVREIAIPTEAAQLTASAALDLDAWRLRSDWTFSWPAQAATSGDDGGTAPAVAVAFEGPVSAPQRSLDTAALTAWLSLRQLEQQVEAVESENEALEAEADALDPAVSDDRPGTEVDGAAPPPPAAPAERPVGDDRRSDAATGQGGATAEDHEAETSDAAPRDAIGELLRSTVAAEPPSGPAAPPTP